MEPSSKSLIISKSDLGCANPVEGSDIRKRKSFLNQLFNNFNFFRVTSPSPHTQSCSTHIIVEVSLPIQFISNSNVSSPFPLISPMRYHEMPNLLRVESSLVVTTATSDNSSKSSLSSLSSKHSNKSISSAAPSPKRATGGGKWSDLW